MLKLKFLKLKQLLKYTLIFSSFAFTATLQAKSLDSRQINCLAKMSYGEARYESDKGIAATVFVALNRTKDSRFPDTPCKVVQQKGQFSGYNNHPIKDRDSFDKVKKIVVDVVEGRYKDTSRQSLYFNSTHKAPKGTKCSVRIGGHSFYKEVDK